jgi:predicted PurR-regulated permease PerM
LKSKLQFWTLEILLILIIIYISTKISFLFHPIGIFISTLFFPILISGFLFYLLNPVLKLLMKWKVPKILGIVILYLALLGLITVGVTKVVPVVSEQVTDIAKQTPETVDHVVAWIEKASKSNWFNFVVEQDFIKFEEIKERLLEFTSSITSNITSGITAVVSFITNLTLIIITVPFILFYMLKDGHRLPGAIMKFLPSSFKKEGLVVIQETSQTLANYIQGQMTVCIFVGTACFIGFLLIDLPYALTLGLVIAVTNIIPYVGPFIGAAPAVLVGLFQSPLAAFLVILIILIVQQLDGNLISPLIIGKSLNIHPLTIIMILLVAGSLAGILGMILAVPTYAVVKTITKNIVRLFKLYRTRHTVITEDT